MSGQVIVHLLLALVWVLLAGELTARSALEGYLVGAVLLWFLHPAGADRLYFARVVSLIRLGLRFVVEMTRSALIVTAAIWSPRGRVFPGMVELPTALRSDGGVTLLANLITMTPGTMTVEVPPGQDRLYVFALDARRPEQVRAEIREAFERPIREVFR